MHDLADVLQVGDEGLLVDGVLLQPREDVLQPGRKDEQVTFSAYQCGTDVPSYSDTVWQCSNEAASGAKNQEQEQAGSGAEASTGSQELLKSLLSGASV